MTDCTEIDSGRTRASGRGLGPWLEFGDVESQLKVLKPAVLRKYVAASMLPLYALLAQEHGYAVVTTPRKDRRVRLVLWRTPQGGPSAAPAI